MVLAMLLLTASSPYPDMGGVGRAAHGLSENQTALYFMVVVVVVLLVERGITGWRTAATASRLAGAIDKLREVMSSADAQGRADMAVILHVLDRIVGELNVATKERGKIARALLEREK